MRPDIRIFRAGAVALSLGLGAITASPALADEAAARAILGKMSDYLAAQENLSFDFDSTLQIVTTDGERLDIASSGSVVAARPDRIHAQRRGGFASVEAFYDGKTLSVLNADAKTYGQEDLAGTIEDVINLLRDTYHLPMPAADLLAPDAAKVLLAEVTEVKDLGAGVIGGEDCDHLAFRAPEVDFQLWVAQGDAPHPCRFSVTSKTVAGSPSYTIDFSAWGAGAASADFAFVPPEDATQAEIKDIPDLDELSGIYTMKGAN